MGEKDEDTNQRSALEYPSMHPCTILLLAAVLGAPQGLPLTGGLRKAADPKVVAFELAVHNALNETRAKAAQTTLTLDERLRAFARAEAELAATGNPSAATVGERIKQHVLAPYGHYLQFSFGVDATKLVADLIKDKAVRANLTGDFAKAGIGAFFVPADKPYYQVALLLVREPDPMAGKPGLSPTQTDPVMSTAMPAFAACYDGALKEDPNLRGDVVLQVVIGAGGKVDAAKWLKAIGRPAFDDCGLGVGRGLVFPAPYKGKPVTLNHPMRFTPPQGNKRVGRLTPAQLSSGFTRAQGDFKACYDERVKMKPTLGGTLTLALRISADGAVDAVDVLQDELADGDLAACVVARARSLRFAVPEFAAPLDVTYPLRFEPPPPAKH